MIKVITYGTFDFFHEGHYQLLQRAKALGDYLIVGVTSENYDATRGKLNVIDSLMTRAENVRKTSFADEIIIEEYEGQKVSDVKKYNIDIFTVGSDWGGAFDYMSDYCKVVYLEWTKDISSTIIRKDNKRIQKVGIIGTGRIAKRFMTEVKFVSGITVHGVYNPHKVSAEEFAEIWKIDAYADLADFFLTVDLVYIASPHETHYAYIKAALNHGKHVLCEKPMVLKKEQAEELFQYAGKHKLILFEGIKTAYCPGFEKLLGVAFSGVIGTIHYVDACFTKLVSNDNRELTDHIYGGSFFELGSYCLLPIIKLFGINIENIQFNSINEANGLDIFTKVSFRYQRGYANAVCGLGVKADGRLMIAGTKGYIVAEAPWWKTTYFEVHYENPLEVERYSESFFGDGLRYEIRDFLNMVNGRSNSKCKLTCSESIAIAEIMERFMKVAARKMEDMDSQEFS